MNKAGLQSMMEESTNSIVSPERQEQQTELQEQQTELQEQQIELRDLQTDRQELQIGLQREQTDLRELSTERRWAQIEAWGLPLRHRAERRRYAESGDESDSERQATDNPDGTR